MEPQKVPFISIEYLQKAKKQSNVLDGARGIVFKNDDCEACNLGKHCRTVFLHSNTIYEDVLILFTLMYGLLRVCPERTTNTLSLSLMRSPNTLG